MKSIKSIYKCDNYITLVFKSILNYNLCSRK